MPPEGPDQPSRLVARTHYVCAGPGAPRHPPRRLGPAGYWMGPLSRWWNSAISAEITHAANSMKATKNFVNSG